MYGSDTSVNEELVARVELDNVGKLCIRRNGNQPKQRKYNVLAKFGLDHNLGVYNNGVDAISRALTERYFFCKNKEGSGFRNIIPPRYNAFNNTHFKDFHSKVMGRMPNLPRLSRQQVVDRYTGSKRRVYENAMISLMRDSLNERDAHLKMFVKFEKQDLSKAPRGINPRDPRFNLELGRYLKHAEKPFFRAINKAFDSVTEHTVIKGLNSTESATVIRRKWDSFKNPVAIGLDAEKFDAHVSVQALQYEHKFYTALFPGALVLKKLLGWQLHNVGKAYAEDGVVKFRVRGTRSSGDLNTSLGNSIIMCAAIYAYAKQKGVRIELANNGDDCVVIMEKDDQERFLRGIEGWFRDRGFSIVSEKPVEIFEELEFCQTRPVCVGGVWRMIRNHNAVLKKDTMCLIAIQNGSVYRKWLHAVGIGGVTLNSGVPVQNAFYDAYLRHGIVCSQGMIDHINKNTSLYTRIRGMARQSACITPCTRVSYYYAFGVLPDHQIEIEKYYSLAKIEPWHCTPTAREVLDNEPGIKLLDNEISW